MAAFCGLAPGEMSISVVHMLCIFTHFMPFLEIYLTFYKDRFGSYIYIFFLHICKIHMYIYMNVGLRLEEEVVS